MIPKTEVEFRANLGTVVSKSIELKNPSSKAIIYDVTLEGSADFSAKGTKVKLYRAFVSDEILHESSAAGYPISLFSRFFAVELSVCS